MVVLVLDVEVVATLDEGIADLRDVAGIQEVSLTVEQPGSWMVEVPDARRDVPGAQVGGARG